MLVQGYLRRSADSPRRSMQLRECRIGNVRMRRRRSSWRRSGAKVSGCKAGLSTGTGPEVWASNCSPEKVFRAEPRRSPPKWRTVFDISTPFEGMREGVQYLGSG